MTTGEKIAKLRKESNLTQEQFAELMSVSRQSVSKWEQNLAYPETEKLIKLCHIFRCSIDYILREEITNKNSIYEGEMQYCNARSFHKEQPKESIAAGRKKADESIFKGKTGILSLCGISKHYLKEGKVRTILHDVNIDFYENEFVAVTGESGSGKTTLMNLISGSLGYDDGEIFYKGKKFSEFENNDFINYETEEVGYIAQDNKLLMQYTVEQNVLSALLVKGYELDYCYSRVNAILDLVGLGQYRKQRIVKLSAGQRQRVAIARVLAKNPRIILADEVTANLDETTAIMILELLKKLSESCLVIFITHNFAQVMPYVTRHIEIRNKTVYVDEVLTDNLTGNTAEADNKAMVCESTGNANFISCFVKWNIKARWKTSVVVTMLFVLVGIILFGLGDVYFINADDIAVNEFDDSAFKNDDDTRIIIKRKDEGLITDEDLNCIAQLEHVNAVEKYDLVNDIYYYYKPEKDHSIILQYNSCFVQSDATQFMRSISSIGDADLIAGRIPNEFGEVAVPKGDLELLGEEIIVYFKLPFTVGSKNCCQKMRVVGVTDKDDTQLYFSYQDCDMFANLCLPGAVKLLYSYNETTDFYKSNAITIPIINKDIHDQKAMIDYQYLASFSKEIPNGKCRLRREYYDHYGIEVAQEKNCDIYSEYTYMTEERFVKLQNDVKNEVSVIANTDPFLEIGYDTFYEIFDQGSNQMSAFITDYLDTDEVLESINATEKYEAFSPYRLSMNIANPEKKKSRAKLYGIILFVLILLLGTTCFLVATITGLNREDYHVFRHIGMNEKNSSQIFVIQYLCCLGVAFLGIIILVVGLKIADFDVIHEYYKYLRMKQLCVCGLLYITYCVASIVVSGLRLNAITKRR